MLIKIKETVKSRGDVYIDGLVNDFIIFGNEYIFRENKKRTMRSVV